MSTPGSRTWDESIEMVQKAAGEVRSALGRAGSASVGGDPEAARLKSDVARLEQSASVLISKISAGLKERRSEIDSSLDRERAQRSAEQMKASLEELAALASGVAGDIATAANNTLKQSEPELQNVARALEDVVGSASSWIRTAIDPAKGRTEHRAVDTRPPLDDL